MRYFTRTNGRKFGTERNRPYIWAVKSEKEAFALFDDGDINYSSEAKELATALDYVKSGHWIETDRNGVPIQVVAAKPKRKRSRSKKKYYIHKEMGKFTSIGDGKRYVFVIDGEACYALFGGNCRGMFSRQAKHYLPISDNWVETDRYGNPLDPQYNYLKDK